MLTLCTKDHIFKCTRADLCAFEAFRPRYYGSVSVCRFVSAIANQPSGSNLLFNIRLNTSSKGSFYFQT